MSAEKEKTHIFDKPENVDRLLKVFYAICILLVGADFIVHRHIGFNWEKIPAFYAIYGFVACVLLVVLAKRMRNVLMREEDYYDE
jgi:predicted tellurium resistance membrane protein TerC